MRSVACTLSGFLLVLALAVPSVSSAAALSANQTSALIGILRAFNVDEATIVRVETILAGGPLVEPTAVHARPLDSIYPSSSMGYDISFATAAYPVDPFGFGTVGVTRGKAFVHNPRFASQYAWGHFASSVAPSLYLNVNAPYGSTATAATMSSPKECDALFTSATSSAGTATGVYPEPTVCGSYNYGYNAAKDALAYATANGARAGAFWWLDVEEENSWSENVAVNDAVIQGALDYLNSRNIRAGIYSMPYMWRNIAGRDFVPTQMIGGKAVTTPSWLPIGIATQVGAINACITREPFIQGSPIWVVQYVASPTAIDQNIAC